MSERETTGIEGENTGGNQNKMSSSDSETEDIPIEGLADLFDTFFEMQPDMFFLVDADGTIRDYRAPRDTLLYAPPSFFLKKKITEVLPPHVGRKFSASAKEAVVSSGHAGFEYDLALPDGLHRFECRLNSIPSRSQCIAIIRDITINHQNRMALVMERKALQERIKEQRCLYAVIQATDDPNLSVEAMLHAALGHVPEGFQYPEICTAALAYGQLRIQTSGHRVSDWTLRASTKTEEGIPLLLEVSYLEERPEEAEGPFFHEERAPSGSHPRKAGHCDEPSGGSTLPHGAGGVGKIRV